MTAGCRKIYPAQSSVSLYIPVSPGSGIIELGPNREGQMHGTAEQLVRCSIRKTEACGRWFPIAENPAFRAKNALVANSVNKQDGAF